MDNIIAFMQYYIFWGVDAWIYYDVEQFILLY